MEEVKFMQDHMSRANGEETFLKNHRNIQKK